MMRFLAMLVALALLAPAQPKKRTQRAHEHEAAELSIAVDGLEAVVEFHAPGEGILGFEHEARTALQKKQQEAALAKIRSRIAEMVILPPACGCSFLPRSVAVEREPGEDHAEVKAEFGVKCAKPLAGNSVGFGISKVFPAIQRVQVQVLSGTQQTGLEVRGDRGSVALPR